VRSRRRHDPWNRLRRHLTADGRKDLQLVVRVGVMLDDGQDPAEIRAALDFTADDAWCTAGRIREALRAARVKPEPASRLARVLAALDEAASG
jgi:hypothetical protein